MKFTLSWLKKFLYTDASIEDISHSLTMIGLEVEGLYNRSHSLDHFEVAEVVKVELHPNADKLKICTVKSKDALLKVICGANNIRLGIKVALAKIGAILPSNNIKIEKIKIRGIDSMGMICSEDELSIFSSMNTDKNSIIELPKEAVIGNNIVNYLDITDPVFHINVTPNRSDALSVYGVARDLAASGIGSLVTLETPNINETFSSHITLSNKQKKACPVIMIRELRNLNNKVIIPDWLKCYLHHIGISSISPIVDILNYITNTFGQPLHVYDANKISGGLIVDTLSESVCFNSLTNKNYILEPGDIITKDNTELVHCLSGIIGSKESACSINSNRIILEAASFTQEHIIRSGRRLQINSDSRYRFERHVDSEFIHSTINLATDLIISICGGEASYLKTIGNEKLPIKKIDFTTSFLQSKVNINLTIDEVITILVGLGFKCKMNHNESIEVIVPSWRQDISLKEDIVEEILRIYGYNKLPETPLPPLYKSYVIPVDQKNIFDFKRIMSMSGYIEVVTWSFMHSNKAKLFTNLKEELKLKNPISSDLDYMRPTMLANLLNIIHYNFNRSFQNLSIFELGPVFQNISYEATNNICGLRTGNIDNQRNMHSNQRKFDLFDIKSDIKELLEYIGINIDDCHIKNGSAPSYFNPASSASIYIKKQLLGFFGQVNQSILKEFKICQDVVGFEINITKLINTNRQNRYIAKRSRIISNYPSVVRDYSFFIDQNQPVGEVLNTIRNINRTLIKSVELFDLYVGNNVQKGKKSLAISVTIQDGSKTLEETEIIKINDQITNAVVKNFGAIIRDK